MSEFKGIMNTFLIRMGILVLLLLSVFAAVCFGAVLLKLTLCFVGVLY